MSAVRFHAVIDENRMIRVPPGIDVLAGAAEVILLQPDQVPAAEAKPTAEVKPMRLAQRLAHLAEELGITELPPDLAENHDYYAHGAPKGIDQQ